MGEPSDFIPSRASSLKSKPDHFETVVYESYKSKKQSVDKEVVKEAIKENKVNELNVRQTKNEIFKLAMSGLDSEEKEKAKINMLIKLGAKPPKNKGKNYKELLLEKKKTKEKEAKQEKLLQLGKNKIGKSTAKGKSFDKKRRKGKGDILSIYGKVKQKPS